MAGVRENLIGTSAALKHGCLCDENRAIRRFSRLLHSPSLRLRDGNPTIHTPSSRPYGRESQSDAEPDTGNRRTQCVADSLDGSSGYSESDSGGSHSDSVTHACDDIVRREWEYPVRHPGSWQAGLCDQSLLAGCRVYRRPRLPSEQRSQGSIHGKNLPGAVAGRDEQSSARFAAGRAPSAMRELLPCAELRRASFRWAGFENRFVSL